MINVQQEMFSFSPTPVGEFGKYLTAFAKNGKMEMAKFLFRRRVLAILRAGNMFREVDRATSQIGDTVFGSVEAQQIILEAFNEIRDM